KWEPVFGERSCSNKELDRDGDSTKRHHDLAPALPGSRLRLVSPDWRGHGRCPKIEDDIFPIAGGSAKNCFEEAKKATFNASKFYKLGRVCAVQRRRE
ncbi:hypothetical protein, partial [Mesorhizobium sp. B3-1-6]|uniref:hypothetical protein n=1 Tax=Mesorhizobium sp. B3-1-6 TaxID=2589895 RepID=UPI001AEE4BC4